jgi:hypothetical protein
MISQYLRGDQYIAGLHNLYTQQSEIHYILLTTSLHLTISLHTLLLMHLLMLWFLVEKPDSLLVLFWDGKVAPDKHHSCLAF